MFKFLSFIILIGCAHFSKEVSPELKLQMSSWQQLAAKHQNMMTFPQFESNGRDIKRNIDQAIKKADQGIAEIINMDAKERNFENTIVAIDRIFNKLEIVVGRHYLLNYTSPNKDIRDAASESIEKQDIWFNGVFFREDLYSVIKQFKKQHASLLKRISAEDKKYLSELELNFKRNGFALSKKSRDLAQKIQNQISKLSLDFANNIKEDKTLIRFSQQQLIGLPESALASLPKDQKQPGFYLFDPKISSHYESIVTHADNEEVRKRAMHARNSIAIETNPQILKKIVQLRAKLARVLGYKNFADYSNEQKMASNGATAINFIKNLSRGLQPKFEQEIKLLTSFKKKHLAGQATPLTSWDVSYYENKLLKQNYNVDMEQLKRYFPLPNVMAGMFAVFSELFNIKLETLSDVPYKWADDDIKGYIISDSRTGEPLGVLYMDLFPRENKYNHFAHFSVQGGRVLENDTRQRPVGVLVCNFPKPQGEQPSLLSFREVETLFHEFGHALHSALSKTKYLAFHGTMVPRDFVEAPSQMLEFWVHDSKVLDLFAADYEDPTKKIPKELLAKLNESIKATIAIKTRGQISYAMLDLDLHTKYKENDDFDIVKVTNQSLAQYYMPRPAGSAMVAGFGHLTGGYAAGYYGYQWSLAIANDLATKFKKSPNGFFDKQVGQKLRTEIYQQGSSRPASQSLRSFLGRDWNSRAYLQYLGISTR